MNPIKEKATAYYRAAGRTGLAHYYAGEEARRLHQRIGIPGVILSTIVATSVFATIQDDPEHGIKLRIATGLLAVISAVFAGLQAFLNLSDRAEKHKDAGARYGEIRRSIDLFLLRIEPEVVDQAPADGGLEKLEIIAQTMSELATSSPSLAQKIYEKGRGDYDLSKREKSKG